MTCTAPDCKEKIHAKRLCSKHYQRFSRLGKLTVNQPRIPGRTCCVKECEGAYYASSYCLKHYERVRRNGDAQIVINYQSKTGKCENEGCERKHYALGCCRQHYCDKYVIK